MSNIYLAKKTDIKQLSYIIAPYDAFNKDGADLVLTGANDTQAIQTAINYLVTERGVNTDIVIRIDFLPGHVDLNGVGIKLNSNNIHIYGNGVIFTSTAVTIDYLFSGSGDFLVINGVNAICTNGMRMYSPEELSGYGGVTIDNCNFNCSSTDLLNFWIWNVGKVVIKNSTLTNPLGEIIYDESMNDVIIDNCIIDGLYDDMGNAMPVIFKDSYSAHKLIIKDTEIIVRATSEGTPGRVVNGDAIFLFIGDSILINVKTNGRMVLFGESVNKEYTVMDCTAQSMSFVSINGVVKIINNSVVNDINIENNSDHGNMQVLVIGNSGNILTACLGSLTFASTEIIPGNNTDMAKINMFNSISVDY